MKRSAKASAKARVIATLDGLVKQLVFHRDGYECVKCHRKPPEVILQPSHIKTKGRYSRLRFEMLNILCMCKGCHYVWHGDTTDAMEWLERAYPGRKDQLNVLAAVAQRLDFKELLIGLKLEVDQLP